MGTKLHSIETFFNKILNVSDAKACFSSKVEYRVVIQYLYLKGKTARKYTASLPMFMGLLHHLMLGLNYG